MKKQFVDRVIDMLNAIPDISVLTVCPSIFSDDIDKHDCDRCEFNEFNKGDTYDPDVCKDCWKRAIREAAETDMSNHA